MWLIFCRSQPLCIGTRATMGEAPERDVRHDFAHRELDWALNLTRRWIRAATCPTSSCSHILTTSQPARRNLAVVSASRRRVASSFAAHHPEFVFGMCPCSGQECQKHPSTNTATLEGRNTTSALRGRSLSGRASTLYRRPIRWSSRRKLTSAGVSRRRTFCMRCRTCSDDAGGRAAAREPGGGRVGLDKGTQP